MNQHGVIEYINPVAASLMLWTLEEVHGRNVDEVLFLYNEVTGERYTDIVRNAIQNRAYEFSIHHIELERQSGERLPVVITGSAMRNYRNETIGAVLVFRDVSELRKLEEQLSYEASHDALTGLINRREFEKRVDKALSSAIEEHLHHVLLYVDLDQFKVVNDTSGHVAGDELLKQLANRLADYARDSDAFARLGGDEFGLLLENCPLEKAAHIAENLRHDISKYRFAWDDKTFEIGASIGVVPIVRDSGTFEDLLRAADSACYVAKENGRNRIHIYDADDSAIERRQGEMQWVSRIKRAIEEEKITLHVQKISAIDGDDDILHYEMLMRMQDDDGSLIPPMAFIPAAERYGLMPQLDRYVIRKACGYIKQCEASASQQTMRFSINLSGQSLSDDDFLDVVVEEINRSEIDEKMICFEITETAAIGNLIRAKRFISILRGMGCLFSLDDFGSGLSSFGYLKNLDVSYLKIDGGFIRDICNDPVNESMVRSINEVGHVLGMKTIAEFVENDEILNYLKDIGIDYVQGYGIEKPHPIDDLLTQRDM
jgi:diguanylate cyclase (GGDEF)-like protein/PAS domain S-box-containing protein